MKPGVPSTVPVLVLSWLPSIEVPPCPDSSPPRTAGSTSGIGVGVSASTRAMPQSST